MSLTDAVKWRVSSFNHLHGGESPLSIEKFILECGALEKSGSPLPKNIRKGPKKECFVTCAEFIIRAGLNSGYWYMEGLAESSTVKGFPIHHAWLEDVNGNVFDPTWDDPEKCTYLGIAIPYHLLLEELAKNKVYCVLDPGYGLNARFMEAYKPIASLLNT